MSYATKHCAARKSSPLARVAVVALAGGATMIGGLAAAPAASAAPGAAPGSVWDRVAACESGGNWSTSTGNGYHGGLQFSASSWRAAGGTRYASMPHRATKAQQIAAAKNLLRMQGPNAWPVCSRKAGLNSANGRTGGGSVAASRSSTRASAQRVQRVRSASRVTSAPRAYLTRAQNRQIQSWLGVKRTGFLNRPTVAALQKRVGAASDGVIGRQLVRQTENRVGAKSTGLSYFSKGTLNQLLRHARAN